jgi:hypothetical protein
MIRINADGGRAGDAACVQFLDAGGAPCDELVTAIESAIESLSDDGVLTVFSSRDDARAAVEAHCDAQQSSGVSLVTAFSHSNGITFVIRRAHSDVGDNARGV